MSRKESAVKEKPKMGATSEGLSPVQEGKEEQSGDFWGNLIYCLVLTIVIGFVLANNSVDALTSTTGIVILGILVLLDIFPVYHLIKNWWYGRD